MNANYYTDKIIGIFEMKSHGVPYCQGYSMISIEKSVTLVAMEDLEPNVDPKFYLGLDSDKELCVVLLSYIVHPLFVMKNLCWM